MQLIDGKAVSKAVKESVKAECDALKKKGVTKITFLCLIAAPSGVEKLQKAFSSFEAMVLPDDIDHEEFTL